MIDLDKIEALARAATAGPWLHRHDPGNPAGCQHGVKLPGELGAWIADCIDNADRSTDGGVAGERNAAFIAAANPAAALELIALARQADTIYIPVLTGAELVASFPLPGSHVQRINLSHGAYVERETKSTGEPGWLLRAPDGTAVRGLNAYEAEFIDSALSAASAPAQPVQQPAPVAEPHYEAGRKQGRAEAMAILMQLDPEGGIDEYTGWSTPVGPEDEGAAYWEEDKLRELFAADGALADMMDRAEAQYWEYIGMRDEVERAKNFAANMHNSGKVREVLSRAGEFDLMGYLCTTAPVQPFQQRVQPWMIECFGAEISADTKERNHRFFEESTELVQAHGMTASEAHQLVDYVYGRPVGEPAQEVGGVMVTLAALCLANGLDMHQAAEVELARIWTKVEAIRAKQAAKPKHPPLPAPPNVEAPIEAALAAFCDQEGYPSDGPMDGVLRKAFAAGASFAFDWKGGA